MVAQLDIQEALWGPSALVITAPPLPATPARYRVAPATNADDHPLDVYTALVAEATRLAGEPGDIAPRVALLHALYLDSGGNHAFPEIALHGALWAHGALRLAEWLGDILRYRYCYDARRRSAHREALQQFLDGLRSINRQVFIDTYALYYVTKRFGRHPALRGILPAGLARGLAAMHIATRAGRSLSPPQKRHLFLQALHHEQESTVAPGVRVALARFDRPVLRAVLLRPAVRFAYFPRHRYFVFRDFSERHERIDKAVRAYDLAVRAGWPAVSASMRAYGVLPEPYFADPAGYLHRLAPARPVIGQDTRCTA